MILQRIFEKKQFGFYIDVGAYHPRKFSNTYHFYKRGWKGINIDCNPGSMIAFNKRRKRDINLEFAISDRVERLKYYKYDEPAINSFDLDFSTENSIQNVLLKTIELKTVTLESVLKRYLPDNLSIDYLSIDVEGMDLKVLNSNNWGKYRPKIVLVEDLLYNYDYNDDTQIARFMSSVDYVLFAKTVSTFIFRERYFEYP